MTVSQHKSKSPTICVALLRGINVGGNSKVEMSKLKKVFESIGFINVRTYINSGNVIFETEDNLGTHLTEKIEKALLKHFAFAIRALVRDAKNINKLCASIPSEWTNDANQKTDILVLWDEYDSKNSINLIPANPVVDILRYETGAIVWNVKKKDYTKSGMKKFIGTPLYKNMTARNVNTLRKLGELMK